MPRRRRKRSILPVVLMAVGAMLIVGAIAYYAAAMQPLSPAPGSAAENASQPAIPFPDVPRVSLADARAAFETGGAVFLDVRGEPYYSQGHIPGALSIDENELADRLNELNQEDWIITYCT